MSGLLAAINGGLNGSGLIAQDDGGVIRIVEISTGVAVPLRHHSCLRQYLATARYLQLVRHPAAEALR